MPDQSASGSLTERLATPRVQHAAEDRTGPDARGSAADVEPSVEIVPSDTTSSQANSELSPSVVDDAGARAVAVVDGWRRSLAGTGMPDTLLVAGIEQTASWLDLTHAHPSGLAQLFAARPTRLSSLFRESAAHAAARRQARAIRASATTLAAQRGVQGCCLAIGIATWRPASRAGVSIEPATGPVHAPVVLRACAVRPRGAGHDDYDLDLDDAVFINPELVRELVETHGIDADGAYLASLAHGEKGFDPRPVYAWLEEHCRRLPGFTIGRNLVLATFSAGSGAVLSDLDAALTAIASHDLLGRVAAAADDSAQARTASSGDASKPGVPADDGPPLTETSSATGPGAPPAGVATGQDAGGAPPIADIPAQPGGRSAAEPGREASQQAVPAAQSGGPRGVDDLRVSDLRIAPPSASPETQEQRRVAVVGRLAPRRPPGPVRPPEEADPGDEHVVLDLDPAQQQVVASVLRGEHVVVEGPPGTGVTQALAASIAALVEKGRRVLVLSARRSSTEALLDRLEAAGISDLVLDLQDAATAQGPGSVAATVSTLRRALAAASGEAPAAPAAQVTAERSGEAQESSDPDEALRRARALLDGAVTALHETRTPWGVSAYDAMVALAELTGRASPPRTSVRLSEEVLARLDRVTRERLRVHLHAAAAAGAFTLSRVDTRWYDAQVETVDDARRALEAALLVRAGLDRTRAAMDSIAAASGLRPARCARDWIPLLDVLLGVRDTVDAMVPQVYEQPLDDLVAATAPRAQRRGDARPRKERRQLRRQAQALVRPGVYVPDLHSALIDAREQRRRWAELSDAGELPTVVVGLSDAAAAAQRVLSALDVLAAVFAGTDFPDPRAMLLDDLERRIFDLAGDKEGILGQPRRVELINGLHAVGLGALVDDLKARRVGPDGVDGELDLAWWSSVLDCVMHADPRLSRNDGAALRRAGEELRAADRAHIASGAARVRAAVLSRASTVLAAHPGQVRRLRDDVAREDRSPRLPELVRRAGDVLGALCPVWVMSPDAVAGCLRAPTPGGAAVVDTVVVDDAGQVGLPEAVASLARGRQIVLAGDRRRFTPPDGGISVLEAVAPFAEVCRLDRDHRTHDGRMLVPVAARYPEGWQLTPGIGVLPLLRLEAVADGIAVPLPGEEIPLSADAEVRRVVELVSSHALRNSDESLVVVTLGERHAERIEEALRAEVSERPALARWLADRWRDGRAEPFLVRPVHHLPGVERDAAIVSIGLARTPHGRVLHRFDTLDGDSGAACLITALSRARRRTTVVCCFTAEDLVVERLRTDGARLLREVLLTAGRQTPAGTGRTSPATDGLVADLRDRLITAGLPVQSRISDGAWPLDIAIADPRTPGRMLVAVDIDGPSFALRSSRERERQRPERWEHAGWTYCRISAVDLHRDPALEVARIRDAWERALAQPVDASEPDPSSRPQPPRLETGRMATDPSEPPGRDVPTSPSVTERRHGQGDPVLPEQSMDDTDQGWGERAESDDDQLLRERPPHWD